MKKMIIIGLCLIGLIAGTVALVGFFPESTSNQNATMNEQTTGVPHDNSGEVLGGQLSYKIILNTSLISVPAKIVVYKMVTPTITKTDAIAFAKKFNVTDIGEIKEGDEKISIASKDNRYHIQLFKNGGKFYHDTDRPDSPDGIDKAENLPSDDDAARIATAFLKERDLLPEGAILKGTERQYVHTLYSGGGAPIVDWEDTLVYFGRELNGINVEGTQYEIEVAAHGDIIRYFANWKNYQPIGEYPVKSPKTAFQELQQKGINVGSNKPDTISINKVYLAYYTKALASPEQYLEPVWVFNGEAMVNGKPTEPVKEFIPALTKEPAELVS